MKKIVFIAFILALTPLTFTHADASSTPDSVIITIRDGDGTAFSDAVILPDASSSDVQIAPTNSSTTVAVSARSLLATLITLDATTTNFDITDLGYFSSFNSFIINCIAVPSGAAPDCFNWTDAINGGFPQIGIDHQILQNGDNVVLFFGPPRQTILSTTTAPLGTPFTATAESYDLSSGVYVPAPGVTLGVGTPNPDFSFTELATSTADSNGQAVFTLNATGTFSVGIKEDFYFPAVSITLTEAQAISTDSEVVAPPPPPAGGGGGGGISHLQLNVSSALAYLAGKQKNDGSFGSLYLSDWAAVALAAADPGAAKTALHDYLLAASPALSSVTDYERHAMALEALGINPYSGTSIDYISPITKAFDGAQIGDASLDNDDIFALFPLLHAGYGTNDAIIQKTVAFIIGAQVANGSWDNSVDMTAAAVQALSLVSSLPDVNVSIAKATAYLHTQQQNNGGFSNSFSTSWVLQTLSALNEPVTNWAPIGYTPQDYLAGFQQSDGGLELTSSSDDTRIWATGYAIPASLGKTWSSLLQSFPKPSTTTGNSGSGSGSVLGASTTTVATSSESVATTTPPVATSTPPAATSIFVETSGATTTTPSIPKPAPKKIAAKKTVAVAPVAEPTPVETQTAAAIKSGGGGFFSAIWYAITSFFAMMF